MGFIDVAGVSHALPDGRPLLADVSFRVGDGVKAALVGANGAGKTTLLRIIAVTCRPRPARSAARVASASCGSSSARCAMRRPSRTSSSGSRHRRSRRAGTSCSSLSWRSWNVTTSGPRWRTPMRSRTGAMPAATTSRCSGTPSRSPRSAGPTTNASTANCPRCQVVSRSGSRSRRYCAGPTKCCCSTSPTTTSTSRASAGSRNAWSRRRRPSCSSATTASCWPGSPTGSSRSRAGRPGCTAVASRRITRLAPPSTTGWPRCAAVGTRSTPG